MFESALQGLSDNNKNDKSMQKYGPTNKCQTLREKRENCDICRDDLVVVTRKY